eukprot:GHUV01054764.1.p1 GENE.GHUV01054764.1~~GHUV01054764.1.p1  ORF type:complete len:179 (-),score=38.52 GHUV01054764.1:137-673(-)
MFEVCSGRRSWPGSTLRFCYTAPQPYPTPTLLPGKQPMYCCWMSAHLHCTISRKLLVPLHLALLFLPCPSLPQADGIMLATPTGSTAYSVAAGGSMVHPNVQAILLTPICPHSLNFRPIILPDYIEMELRVPETSRVSAWVCFDGKQRQELHRGDSVFVRMSENPVPTINRADLTTDW